MGPIDKVTPHISDEHRNGSITAIGIVLGFSLSFLASWSLDEQPWNFWSLPVLAFLSAGIALQMKALYDLLRLPNIKGSKHTTAYHNKAALLFLLGTCSVFVAFLLLVAIGVYSDMFQ